MEEPQNIEEQQTTSKISISLKGDKTIWTMFFILVIVSIVEGFSASSQLSLRVVSYTYYLQNHVFHLFSGFVGAFLISNLNFKFVKSRYVILVLWGLSILTLGAAIFLGHSYQGSSRSFAGIQPIEFIKYFIILYVAITLAENTGKDKNPDDIFKLKNIWPVLITFIIGLENLSSLIIIIAIIYFLFFIAKVSWKKIMSLTLGLIILCGIVLTIGLTVPAKLLGPFHRVPTHITRVVKFVSPSDDTENAGISQEDNSQIAISYGHLYPIIPGSSKQKDYLQNAQDDYIFAIIVEELGYILTFLLVILPFLVILFRIAVFIKKSDRTDANLMIAGCGLLITTQALIHMAVTCHLGPVTGQSLPLISNGGSAIWAVCIGFGIIQCGIKTIQNDISTQNTITKEKNNDNENTEISD